MPVNTFDVIERRKHITFFKLGKLWVFKQFFDNREEGIEYASSYCGRSTKVFYL